MPNVTKKLKVVKQCSIYRDATGKFCEYIHTSDERKDKEFLARNGVRKKRLGGQNIVNP